MNAALGCVRFARASMTSCNKISYETKKLALKDAALIRANSLRMKNTKMKKLSAYKCPRCSKYHLTSLKQKRKY